MRFPGSQASWESLSSRQDPVEYSDGCEERPDVGVALPHRFRMHPFSLEGQGLPPRHRPDRVDEALCQMAGYCAQAGRFCFFLLVYLAVVEISSLVEKAFEICSKGVKGPVHLEFPMETVWPQPVIRDELLRSSEGKEPSGNHYANGGLLISEIELFLDKAYDYCAADVTCVEDMQKMAAERRFKRVPKDFSLKRRFALPSLNESHSLKLIDLMASLSSSRKPVFVLGSQIMEVDQVREIQSALAKIAAPFYLAGFARGLMVWSQYRKLLVHTKIQGREHPLQMFHGRGSALKRADFVLFLGTSIDFRVDFGRSLSREASIFVVNNNEDSLSLNLDLYNAKHTFLCNPAEILIRMAADLEKYNFRLDSEWVAYLRGLQTLAEGKFQLCKERDLASLTISMGNGKPPSPPLHPISVCEIVNNYIADDSYIIVDGGDFVATASYIVKPRNPLSWLDPGPFGTLGVGAGFSMACKLFSPKSEVWLLMGDGASGWSMMEFDTLARHKIPVIAVIGNDGCWSQMRRNQLPVFGDSVGAMLAKSRYDQIASALGASGFEVHSLHQLEEALCKAKKLASSGTPVLINAHITESSFREGSISL